MTSFSYDLKISLNKLTSLEEKLEEMNSQEPIEINIGGTIFTTFKSTLNTYNRIEKRYGLVKPGPNLLESFVVGISDAITDKKNNIFIDRDPKYFELVLDYLRKISENDEKFELPDNENDLRGLMKDAVFYRLNDLFEISSKKLSTCWFPDSFLNFKQKEELIELCKFPKTLKWRLIYKASKDGFAADDFHSKCDGFEGTLTIIKTKKGNYIFGGYTDACWSHSDGFKEDKNAFIFSLVNRNESQFKCLCSKFQTAIFCHKGYGPTFGDGHDIFIENNSNVFSNSHSNLGDSYKNAMYEYSSIEAKALLAGSINFSTSDVEVYSNQ